jgi:hypothetical protein
MLFAIFPLAVVDTTILPGELALTLTLVIHEVTFVLLAIFPGQNSVPMHLILLPLTFVSLTIRPHVTALA